jgi:DNA-binding CsgD family transcriptional regulator
VRLHREALAIFEQLNDAAGMATTYDLLGMARYHTADLAESAGHYARAIALLRDLDDRQGLISGLSLLSARGGNLDLDPLAIGPAEAEAGIHAGEEALRLAREIDSPAGEAFALFMLGMAAGVCGDYARAFAHGQAALAISEAIAHRQWIAAAHRLLGQLHLDLLALVEAQHHLERALALARALDSSFWIQSVSAFLASTYILQGETHQADALLAASGALEAPVETLGQQLIARARIELALARHDPVLALALVDGARAAGSPPSARLELLRAAALVAAQRYAEAEEYLLTLRERIAATGLRPLTWRVEQQLGTLYSMTGRRGEADSAFRQARLSAAELAASLPDAHLRAAFQEGVARPSLAAALSVRRDTAPPAGGLTPREREVAALIGRGLSNGEIAAALFVSKRTIETHIGSIYGKLGYTARTQIARWAVETGLLAGEIASSGANVDPASRPND